MAAARINYEIAHAAGRDAGDRLMRKAGRAAWNKDDWEEACAIMTALLRQLPQDFRFDICPVCGKPAHATESDDLNRHEECEWI